jgi:tellurite resistance protein TerC
MLIWIGFIVLVAAFLALDLGVFNKNAHIISVKEAFRWTGVWVSFSLLFSIFIYFAYENHWVHEGGAPFSGLLPDSAAIPTPGFVLGHHWSCVV